MARKEQTQPLVIQYTNLLHKHGSPDATPVVEFRKAHKDDTVFLKRAQVLDTAFKTKLTLA